MNKILLKVNSKTGKFWEEIVKVKALLKASYFVHQGVSALQESFIDAGKLGLHFIWPWDGGQGDLQPIRLPKLDFDRLVEALNRQYTSWQVSEDGYKVYWNNELVAYSENPKLRMDIRAVQRGRVKPIYIFK